MQKTTLRALALLGVTFAGCDDGDDAGDGEGIMTVTAGDGLSGGGSSAVVNLALDYTKVARAAHGHAWGELTGVPTATTAGAQCDEGEKATGVDVRAGTVTCDQDADTLAGLTCADGQVVTRSGGAFVCAAPSGGGGGGGVTQITAGAGLTGGTITGTGTIAVDFNMVAPLMHGHHGLWQAYDTGEYRHDGHIGIGAFPFAAIQVDDANAQLVLRDRAGASPPAIFMDDADLEAAQFGHIVWQRMGVAVAQIFVGQDNSAVVQTEGGALRFKTSAATEAMRIDGATANVGIRNSLPLFPLVVGADTVPGVPDAPHNDGNMWVNRSSRASKEDIRRFGEDDYARVKRWLEQTDVVWFRYKAGQDSRPRVGLIAEDVPDVLATPDRKGIATGDAIGFLTAAAKELSEENTRLQAENVALAKKLAALEARMTRLEASRRK
jgi:hypothetical protein